MAAKKATRKKASKKRTRRKASAARRRSKPDGTRDDDHSTEEIIAALREGAGVVGVGARILGVHRITMWRYVNKYPEVKEALEEINEEELDDSELRMLKAKRAGHLATIRWHLATKGKHRGYSQRVEATGKDGSPIETAPQPDLSGYTPEELAQLYRIRKRAEKRATGQK